MSPDKPPKARIGYRWEYRTGCDCKSCPWKGNCKGEDWPHWIEVKMVPKRGIEPRTPAPSTQRSTSELLRRNRLGVGGGSSAIPFGLRGEHGRRLDRIFGADRENRTPA